VQQRLEERDAGRLSRAHHGERVTGIEPAFQRVEPELPRRETVPSLVKVKVGTDGTLNITDTGSPTSPPPPSGTVHVAADIVGCYQEARSSCGRGPRPALVFEPAGTCRHDRPNDEVEWSG